MAGMIPEDKINEIKNAAEIVSVIGESVTLRRAGQNFTGLCPFHSEKTASFSVSPAKQMFYCFGCGIGGNVIKYVMLKDGLSFPEAVRALARRFGITLDLDAKAQEFLSKKDRLFKVNQLAQEYYARELWKGQQRGLEYLKKRGVSEDTIRKFGLGLSLEDWDGLLSFLRKNGVKPDEALKVGLIIPRKDSSGYYDRFRNRLMFPIYNESGRIIGFGGRVMIDGELPKYLNSPESELYSKSKSLYGLHASKGSCLQTGEVFIVEGYMDAIMLFQYGVQNVAATLGTAMTSEHVRLLKRYAKKRITLVYDSDEAGIRSARRCVDIFLKEHADFRKNDVFTDENADTHILILPKGHDPDSYVREQGTANFQAAAQKAFGIVPFLLEEAVIKHGESVEGKVRVIHELMSVLAVINDKVAQSLYVKQLAERLKLKENLVWDELRNAYMRQKGRVDFTQEPEYNGSIVQSLQNTAPNDRYEMKIVGLCLQHPEYLEKMISTGLRLEHFHNGPLKDLMQELWACLDLNNVNAFIEGLEDAQLRKLAYQLVMRAESCEPEAVALLVATFVNRRKKARDTGSMAQIRAAAKANDESLLLQLLQEKQRVVREAQENKRLLLKKTKPNS